MATDAQRLNDSRAAQRVVNVLNLHAHIQQHNVIIQRTQVGIGLDGFNRQVKGVGFWNHGMHLGSVDDLRAIGIGGVSDDRAREKKDLQDLNERLANYIEKVRFYEAQNRKLTSELSRLRAQVNEPTRIKDLIDVELAQARRLLEEADNEKARLRVTVEELQYENIELRQSLTDALKDAATAKEKFELQNRQLSDLEGEVGLLRRRLASLEAERDKDRERIKKLQDLLNIARKDLNSETLLHIDAANRRQTLVEELAFLKSLHEQELKELRVLICRDSTTENHEYWSTQMGLALREIQEAYDRNVEEMRTETETHYSFQLEMIQTNATKNHMQWAHFKEENVRLREQLQAMEEKLADAENRYTRLKGKYDLLIREREERGRELEKENNELKKRVITLQATIDAMIKEIKIILDSKHGLELEIITYRRLLDTEQNRAEFLQTVNAIEFPDPGNWHQEERTIQGPGTLFFGNRRPEERTTQESGTLTFDQTLGKKIVERLISLTDPRDQSVRERGEVNLKVTFDKVFKSSIAISECSIDGKNVVLVNTLEEEESLRGWSLTRSIDGNDHLTIYKFADSTILRPGQTLKVWARGARPLGAASDLEANQDWLGDGVKVVTYLVNTAGEERATYTLGFGWRR